MLQIDDGPEAGAARPGRGLPRLPWVAAGQGQALGDRYWPRALGREDEGAAIAAQPYGLGKVLWVGHRRHLAMAVPRGRRDPPPVLGPGRPVGRLGQPRRRQPGGPPRPDQAEGRRRAKAPKLQARVAEDVAGLPADLLIAARVFRRDRPGRGRRHRPAEARPRPAPGLRRRRARPPRRRLRRPARRPATGEHLPKSQGAGPIPEAPLEVIARETPPSESSWPPIARPPRAPGRRHRGPGLRRLREAAGLPALLKARSRPVERTEETPLWDHPGTLVLFFAILTAEWALRKRAGLP